MLLDLKLTIRSLARRPWAVAGIISSLALAIAIEIVVMSCVNAVLWRPLAVPNPEQMALIYGHSAMTGSWVNLAYLQLEALRKLEVFEDVAAFSRMQVRLEANGVAEPVNIEITGENYFQVVRPSLHSGRPPEESNEVLLSHDFWLSHYHANAAAVGQTITIERRAFVITGVMAPGYRGPLLDYLGNPKLWLPVRAETNLPPLHGLNLRQNWAVPFFVGIGRMKPGVTTEQAQHAVAAFERHNPPPSSATPRTTTLFPANTSNFYPGARPTVNRVLGLCTLLAWLMLLLACLNAAFFLVGKAVSEARQVSMERALGGSQARTYGRRLLESGLLGAGAFVPGALLASAATSLLRKFPPPLANIVFEPVWDWRILVIALAGTLLSVLLIAIAPILFSMRSVSTPVQSVYAGPSRAAWRLREALVAIQIAVAAIILAATGMVVRSVRAAHSVELGFNPSGLVMASVEMEGGSADAERHQASIRKIVTLLQDRAESLEVATASTMPLATTRQPSRVRNEAGLEVPAHTYTVSSSYFETLQLPLREGRSFLPGPAGANETVVNQALAERLAGNGTTIGRTLEVLDERGRVRRRLHVTGIAQNARYHTLWQDNLPFFYQSAESASGGRLAIILRSSGSEAAAWKALRDTAARVDPSALVGLPHTGNSQLAALIRDQTYLGWLFASLAAAALIIAAGGLMANFHLMIIQRARDIGIRKAIGATRGRIMSGVLGRGILVAAGGLIPGLVAAASLQRWIRPLTPGVPVDDIWPIAVSCVVLLFLAAGAVCGPALRAASIDPWTAIRQLD
jgi:putative ABC transport system permease protein